MERELLDDLKRVTGKQNLLFELADNPFGKYHFDLERIRQTDGGPEEGIA